MQECSYSELIWVWGEDIFFFSSQQKIGLKRPFLLIQNNYQKYFFFYIYLFLEFALEIHLDRHDFEYVTLYFESLRWAEMLLYERFTCYFACILSHASAYFLSLYFLSSLNEALYMQMYRK